ncbi:MAG: ArsR/SmtB family transcription factor [Acidimicrobiales bacterium]
MCTDAQTDEQPREIPTPEQVEVAVGTLRMLAEPTRLRILWLLVEGEQSVGRLAELAGVAPSVVSQHLGKLRLARLVTTRRDGNRIFYAAADVHVRQLLEEALFHADHLVGGIADHESTRRRDKPPLASPTGRSGSALERAPMSP